MSTKKEFIEYIIDQLSDVEGITYRQMMGEYIIYHKGKISAYVCDSKLLVKPVEAALRLLPDAPMEIPYEGASKKMVLVEDIDDRQKLTELFEAMYPELPEPKPKKKK